MEHTDNKGIHIVVATGLYPPDIGGPATYSLMLEEKLCDHGIEVEIVPFGTVRHLPKVIRHFAFAYRIYKALRKESVIYALDPISVGIPAWLIAFLTRHRFWVRLGGDYAWEQGQQRFGLTRSLDVYTEDPTQAPLAVRCIAFIQSFIVRRARVVIAPSEYLKRIIASWGVSASSIHVIYSSLHPLTMDGSKALIREQLGYSGITLTSVGRLVPWKGFDVLLEVFAEVHTEVPDSTLVIIGDGPEYERLQQQIQNLGLESSVRLTGRIGKDALGGVIGASDIFVLNTAYEGLSHQLLEVMDLGVPIVTTTVGGNGELIQDGVSGLLVAPNDKEALKSALLRLMQNTELRTRLVQNAKVRVLAFDQDQVVAEFVDLLCADCAQN